MKAIITILISAVLFVQSTRRLLYTPTPEQIIHEFKTKKQPDFERAIRWLNMLKLPDSLISISYNDKFYRVDYSAESSLRFSPKDYPYIVDSLERMIIRTGVMVFFKKDSFTLFYDIGYFPNWDSNSYKYYYYPRHIKQRSTSQYAVYHGDEIPGACEGWEYVVDDNWIIYSKGGRHCILLWVSVLVCVVSLFLFLYWIIKLFRWFRGGGL